MDYQKTLNLPKTDFSMRAGLAQKEPVILKQWEDIGLYSKIRAKSVGKKSFILHDGPPYANGNIHIGHALNKILKDIIVKFKTMDGYDAFYIPGWDCHGLPIEHQLFKELKKRKSDVDCVDFRRKAYDYAMKYVGIQKEQFKRLGVFGEWDNPYLTVDTEYEYWILRSLAELNEKGYIYRGLKPVNWCFNCETALAEAEVEYEDHVSSSIYVKFEVIDPNRVVDCSGRRLYLLIWTTTPWTLIANVAVAVHPTFRYVVVDTGNELMIIEKTLSVKVLEKKGILEYTIVKEIEGKELTSITYKHPFGMKDSCKVVLADYVTKEDGTGLVHTAPGHGQDDFNTGMANNLDVIMPVDDRGVYTEEAGPYKGEHVFKANKKIIEHLDKEGMLFAQEDISHSYPHCWRCKKPIIFRATKQWFLKIDHDNLRARLKDVIKFDVTWIPDTGRERILAMVTSRPDWCLSRQRYWGVPIPAIICKKCGGDQRLFTEVIVSFAEIVRKEGTNAWFEKDIKDILPEDFKCPDCGGTDFDKASDILDVWFDSGVSNQAVIKARMNRSLPVDLYLEGSDQHRGWFQASLIPAMAIDGKPPFAAVLTHGFVVDGEGRKMSKSLGNVISPDDVIKNSGADILRLWVASSSYNEDIRLSKEILSRLIDAYRKIRNTFRYLLGNLNDFSPDNDEVVYSEMLDIDKWALHHLARVVDRTKHYFEKYEFSKVYKIVYDFCNENLSSFYLDILKDRLYTSATKSKERRSAQTALYYILNCLVRVIAPILCFTAEEVFFTMPKRSDQEDVQSVHLLSWPEIPAEWLNNEICQRFSILVSLRPYVMKAIEEKRRDGLVGSSLQAKVVFRSSSARDLEYLKNNKDILPSVFIVSQIDIVEASDISNAIGGDFPKTEILIEKAVGAKCSRCWNYFPVLGEDSQYPDLCSRCTAVVKEFDNGSTKIG